MSTELDNRPPTPFPDFNNDKNLQSVSTLKDVLNTLDEVSENINVINSIIEPKINKKSTLFINSYITLKNRVRNFDINSSNIISILKISMELVEQLEDVKGTEQRDFAVLLVREIIEKSKMSNSQKEQCLIIIDFGVLDNVVDFVIDASKGNVDVNKVKSKVSTLLSCCK